MALFSKDLGIDLGTSYTRVFSGGQLILEEPTVAAIVINEDLLVEWGKAAQDMMGRAPESIQVMRPMINGVIADFTVANRILEYILKQVGGVWRLFPPRVMITVPEGVTSVERRAVYEAILQVVKRDVFLIQQPLAAAIGVDLPIGTPSGSMILCLGGGATQAAVLSMNAVVASTTLRAGGMALDDAIVTYVRKKYGMIIGASTAEQVKIQIGSAVPLEQEMSMEVQGQDQVSGLPRPITLTTGEIVDALEIPLGDVVEAARKTLERTPPELVSDIIDRGVALCGGGALLRGIDKLLTKELGVPAYLVDNPTICVVKGAARALDLYNLIRRNLPQV